MPKTIDPTHTATLTIDPTRNTCYSEELADGLFAAMRLVHHYETALRRHHEHLRTAQTLSSDDANERAQELCNAREALSAVHSAVDGLHRASLALSLGKPRKLQLQPAELMRW